MTYVILDTNELQQDWLCCGLRYQLIQHSPFHPPLQFVVPALVLEELVANHRRQVAATTEAIATSARKLARLGLSAHVECSSFDYRNYICERFDETLGITVTGWPDTHHESLVARAVARVAPFDERGGGYRDALIWTEVLTLVSAGEHVALVSSDKAFGDNSGLAAALRAEVDGLPGSVELVRDFGEWLLGKLPWSAPALDEAVDRSRDEEFLNWFLASDFQNELEPDIDALGFRQAPLDVNILEATWAGSIERVGTKQAPDGLQLVEYDIEETVEVKGTFYAVDIERADHLAPGRWPGTVSWRGSIPMTLRVGVLFGHDAWEVEELSWRRGDGVAPGSSPPSGNSDQTRMF